MNARAKGCRVDQNQTRQSLALKLRAYRIVLYRDLPRSLSLVGNCPLSVSESVSDFGIRSG